MIMFSRIWRLLRDSVRVFIADDALHRGAAISFCSITSVGRALFIVFAITGLVFGEEAARGAITSQLSELMGRPSADLAHIFLLSAEFTKIYSSRIGSPSAALR